MTFEDNLKMRYISNTFDKSFKFFIENIYLLNPEYEYLAGDEKKKIDSQLFEASIIILALIKLAIEKKEITNNQYSELFKQFMGVKLGELSKKKENDTIFRADNEEEEFYLYSEIFNRIEFFKKELDKFLTSEIWSPPLGVYYYYFMRPGNYTYHNEYTNLEKEEVTFLINDETSHIIDDFIFPHAIKDTFLEISTAF